MRFLGVVLGLTFLFTAEDGTQGNPQQSVPISVVSISSSINFPEEVVLTLEAESDVRISTVRLYYQLGNQGVRIYGYPEFTPSTRIKADFVIQTGGARYLPTGVDIIYSYAIEDEDGHSLETDEFSLEYKDPAYEWKRVERNDLLVLYHDRPVDSVEAVAIAVADRLEDIKDLLGIQASKRQKAVILNNRQEARRTFPVISGRATQDQLYAGFAYGDYDLFILIGLSRSGMVHEMTHLLIDEAIDSPIAAMPSWLNEGLAMYFEPGLKGRDTTLLRAAQRDELFSLRHMDSVPGRPADGRLFYAQARSIVGYMLDAYKQERMAALLRSVNDGLRIEQAVEAAYGMTLDDLDQEWRGQLGRDLSATSSRDLAMLGTTAIIAGSVIVAIAAVTIWWIRKLMAGSVVEDDDI